MDLHRYDRYILKYDANCGIRAQLKYMLTYLVYGYVLDSGFQKADRYKAENKSHLKN